MSTFTKKNLKTGMLVKLRKGTIGVVLLNCYGVTDKIVEVNNSQGSEAPNIVTYSDNFMYGTEPCGYDIMEVRVPSLYPDLSRIEKEFDNSRVVWKRDEPKELTVKQIEELLGYPIKVVKEEEDK